MAVTTGLLDKLDREELQGVIGHEMSHIGNLDIRFTLLVGVLVGSHRAAGRLVPALHVLGRRPAHAAATRTAAAGERRRSSSPWPSCWRSSRRSSVASSRPPSAAVAESLADATAVELTRNPVGLARALRTISDDPEVLEVANRATQHLYIVNPIKTFEERAKSLWDTHPPIGERIRALESIAGQMGTTR